MHLSLITFCHVKIQYYLLYVLQKVELRKADVAWKRTAETAKELTEEEKETQVIKHLSL